MRGVDGRFENLKEIKYSRGRALNSITHGTNVVQMNFQRNKKF